MKPHQFDAFAAGLILLAILVANALLCYVTRGYR